MNAKYFKCLEYIPTRTIIREKEILKPFMITEFNIYVSLFLALILLTFSIRLGLALQSL
jgi:hypothetical protein